MWFQNARAKLRRSLSADDSQVNSPSALPGGLTLDTISPPPADHSQPVLTSTIDQLQLSLLTGSSSPAAGRSHQPHDAAAFLLDYGSQNAPGCIPSVEAYGNFGEAGGGADGEVDPDHPFRPHYC